MARQHSTKVFVQDKKRNKYTKAETRDFKFLYQGFFIGVVSLFWLILKTGRKPSRIQYPCQQTALSNVGLFLIPPLALTVHSLFKWMHSRIRPKRIFPAAAAGIMAILMTAGCWSIWRIYTTYQTRQYYQQIRAAGPIGKVSPAAISGSAVTYLSIPHAMALPSPHRVVSVHDSMATNWTFSCTDSGVCAEYYGDDGFVDQEIVDEMFMRGMKELTGEETLSNAWRAILPNYQTGEIVAIKVNFNATISGGGNSGYEDNDANVDALPQIINSIAAGLTEIGVPVEDIYVFDVARYITDRFRAGINYPMINFIDRFGNGDDVSPATFDSTDPSTSIVFGSTAYSGPHKVSDILEDADYLINVPIMKRHPGAGISLSLKNHLGSVDGFYSGGHGPAMHDYIYPDRSDYESDSNPIVDINLNENIMNKTVLIVGDALYGCWSSNNTPPERWTSFGDDSPNMLFFGVDPVATDSVMFDYLSREGDLKLKSEDILILAADAGLGVHERWSSDTDRQYQAIDYIEIETTHSDTDEGANIDGNSSEGGTSGGGCFIQTIFDSNEP